MARYLVLAHQTASSPELVERVTALAGTDPSSEFVLLVPATETQHLLGWEEGEATEVARRRAEDAKDRLEEGGANVVRASVVDASPLVAIEDELRDHAGEYAAIIMCTLPIGVSRWLRLDLPHRAERKFSLPVIHVVAAPTAAADISPRAGFDTMLVALNGSHSEEVLGPVTFLAKRLASRVSLVHVLEEAEEDAKAERYLDRVARALRQEGLAVNTVLLAGEAGGAIMEFARGGSYGLVAMATCGRGGGAGGAMGDVTTEVLRGWPCPLLLARPGFGDPGAMPGDISRIVVPLDGSGVAEEALPYAEQLARRLALPVTLIEAISVSCQAVAAVPEPAATDVRPSSDWRQPLSDHPLQVESRLDVSTTSYLSDVCQRLTGKGIDATWHAPWGAAPDAILEHVRQGDSALIVMSGHGSSGLDRASVGSVAHAVIRAAPTPVLTVPARRGSA
jgi:nucleotide-binding universal stress UspA family protein